MAWAQTAAVSQIVRLQNDKRLQLLRPGRVFRRHRNERRRLLQYHGLVIGPARYTASFTGDNLPPIANRQVLTTIHSPERETAPAELTRAR
jgi:hypothetical protein